MIGTIASGEVKRKVGSRGAFAVAETITLPNGATFDKTYTVWYDGEESPNVGDIVTVTGEVSVKTREYAAPSGMKTAIDINFNDPKVQVLGRQTVEEEGLPF